MPKQTAAERARLQADEEARQRHDALKFELEEAPSLLIGLIGRAPSVGIRTEIIMDEEKDKVKKVLFHRDDFPSVDSSLSFNSPKWEYEWMERRFNEIVDERTKQKDRCERARVLYGSLSQGDRELLEEFYYDTKSRY